MDQFSAIRVFMRIVETGSVTKAAASLEMPKSTASKFLADLEAHLGTKLLQRSTRMVTVTAEGAEYYEQVGQVMSRLSDADRTVREKSSSPKGRVRVDVHSSMANSILIPALGDFRSRYPGIELAVGVSDRPVNMIEEAVDCVIRLGNLADTALIARTIYVDRLVTCASPEYLTRKGVPTSPKVLKDHETIGYFSALSGQRWPLRFSRSGEEFEILDTSITTNDSASSIAMVLNGLGVSQLFETTVAKEIASGALVPILSEWTDVTAPISVLYPPSKKLSARVRVFIDWLIEHLGKAEGRPAGTS